MAAFGQENSTGMQRLYSPVRGQLGSRAERQGQERATNVSSASIPHLVLPTLFPYSCFHKSFLKFWSKQ